jgi:hypothetical protein
MRDFANFVVGSICMLTTYDHVLYIGVVVLLVINFKQLINLIK